MIHFYATREHLWALERFASSWAPELLPLIRVLPYSGIEVGRPSPPGVHLFADLERLLPTERRLAARLHRRLAERPASYRCLNDPSAFRGRLALLGGLAADGTNDFWAHRYRRRPTGVRYPAFARWADDHAGSLGPPAHSPRQLRNRVKRRTSPLRRVLMRRNLIVVELLDVRGADGLYRKYSAMRIGRRLIPRHVLFSRSWLTKTPDVVTEATAAEELEYLERFPHASQLEAVFERAGIEYGRVDYGFHAGRLQVWEVNSNPVLVPPRRRIHRLRMPGQERSAASIAAALAELEAEPLKAADAPALTAAERLAWRAQAAVSRRYDPYRR